MNEQATDYDAVLAGAQSLYNQRMAMQANYVIGTHSETNKFGQIVSGTLKIPTGDTPEGRQFYEDLAGFVPAPLPDESVLGKKLSERYLDLCTTIGYIYAGRWFKLPTKLSAESQAGYQKLAQLIANDLKRGAVVAGVIPQELVAPPVPDNDPDTFL